MKDYDLQKLRECSVLLNLKLVYNTKVKTRGKVIQSTQTY